MKVQSKDDIIIRLMIALKRETALEIKSSNTEEDIINTAINRGWIDALEWVLKITSKEEDNG
tara:strand:- start:273 stop:458 length:186 start_codon:yes stop_codon:yes gene_type:complete